jgi:scyllo-inositol 2-dehydrogenase (NADP+)
MEQKTINVGIIGFGIAGQVFHAPFIGNLPGLKLSKISTSNPQSAGLARTSYPGVEIVADAASILNDNNIDLVVVGAPNTAHLPLTKAALLAGKHVIVEKPFTISSAEADELIVIAKTQNKILTVHHNRRFDGDFRTIQHLLSSNLLGKLVEYEVHYDRYRPKLRENAWREENTPGSGILYDLGSHLLDQVQILFGLPEEISADVRIQRPGAKTDDHFDLTLNYPELKVIVKGGMIVKQPGAHFMLNGMNGSFIKYGMDVQENALKMGLNPATTPDWGVEPESMWGKINTDHQGLHLVGNIETETGNYMDFFKNVRNAIWGTEEIIVKPEQARNTIRIIELAMLSSQEKRTIPFSA